MKVIKKEKATITIHSPVLTEEERQQRLAEIEKAAANLLIKSNKEKNKRCLILKKK